MFKILVYAYMNRAYSSRDIERLCQRDTHFLWLLQGYAPPSHNTINRFRKERLNDGVLQDLFNQLIEFLYQANEIQFKNLFVDGTKIEANANRYSFVWLRSIMKYETKLHLKIEEFLQTINETYLTEYIFDAHHPLPVLHQCLDFLKQKAADNKVDFVSGKGKRKTMIQRQIESLNDFIRKQTRYSEAQEVIGTTRSSYSKTDPDATFMRMKEDPMKNGQLKPGYNVQLGVEAEYIVGVNAFSFANDLPTFIPFLEDLNSRFTRKFEQIIADAGYESEENYAYLKQTGQKAFIKPVNHEQLKTRKYKSHIGKRENMNYDEATDSYTCANGKLLKPLETKRRKSKSGYEREVTIYESEDCTDCLLRARCTRAKLENNKRLEVSKKMIEYRAESEANIKSEEGIILRKNRSIQVEGAFGILKQDYGFRKFLSRGKPMILIELLLLCMRYNIQKLHNKIQGNRLGHYLHSENVA